MVGQEIVYAPCPCGSGKKFKFCCFKKYRHAIDDDMTLSEIAQMIRCAESGLNEEARADPESERLHDEGYDLMQRHEFAAAREKFRKSREIVPSNSASWNNEASCAWEMGDYEAACAIQREGNAHMRVVDSFGPASLATYAHVSGHEEEALKALAEALAVLPVSVYGALQTCKALALYHRHRDIIDYVSKSGMADSPRLAFFVGVAYANLGDDAAAGSNLIRAKESEYAEEAASYGDMLADEAQPWCACSEDAWPYFNDRNFRPARQFLDDLEDEKDPLVACPPAVAADCIYFLQADGTLDATEAQALASRLTGERAAQLAADLAQMAEDERMSEREEEARRMSDVDAQGRPRESFDEAYLSMPSLRQELSEMEDKIIRLSAQMAVLDIPATDDGYVEMESIMHTLVDDHPDSLLVTLTYSNLVEKHDPKFARGLVESFCIRHPNDFRCAGTLLLMYARSGEFAKAAEIIDHFTLPSFSVDASRCGEWAKALSLLQDESRFREAFPAVHARISEFLAKFTFQR